MESVNECQRKGDTLAENLMFWYSQPLFEAVALCQLSWR